MEDGIPRTNGHRRSSLTNEELTNGHHTQPAATRELSSTTYGSPPATTETQYPQYYTSDEDYYLHPTYTYPPQEGYDQVLHIEEDYAPQDPCFQSYAYPDERYSQYPQTTERPVYTPTDHWEEDHSTGERIRLGMTRYEEGEERGPQQHRYRN